MPKIFRVHNIIQLHGCVPLYIYTSIQHGPPLPYLHGKKLRKQEEINVNTNNE